MLLAGRACDCRNFFILRDNKGVPGVFREGLRMMRDPGGPSLSRHRWSLDRGLETQVDQFRGKRWSEDVLNDSVFRTQILLLWGEYLEKVCVLAAVWMGSFRVLSSGVSSCPPDRELPLCSWRMSFSWPVVSGRMADCGAVP